MRKIESIREIQMAEYEILCKVVDILEKNDLSYVLAGGTLLGSIRHGGFIPWDDDIDLLMPRDDYEKLKRIVEADGIQLENIKICLPGMDRYPFPFIKAIDLRTKVVDEYVIENRYPLSVWVDIFPMDHYPDKKMSHRMYYTIVRLLRIVLEVRTKDKDHMRGGSLIRAGLMCVHYILGGYQSIIKMIDRFAQSGNRKNSSSKHYGNGTWPENMKDYFSEESIFPLTKHIFETREFSIPLNYDLYLTQFYGDYMTPPPEESRKRHINEAYWLDD